MCVFVFEKEKNRKEKKPINQVLNGFRTSLGFGGSKTSVGIQYFSRVLAKL